MDEEAAAMNIFLPVLEAAMIYAAHYCKKCGRDVVTSQDVQYGWRYAAMTTVGKHLGSHFPEIYDDEPSGSDEGSASDEASASDDESVDEADASDEEVFTRYTGTEDETCLKMNEAFDNWDSWEPESPAERAIKNAVNAAGDHHGRVDDTL